jgi:hypothetical protein
MCNKALSREEVLTELRHELSALLDFADALDAKLNMLLGSGSLVLGLFSSLGLLGLGQGGLVAPGWYWCLVLGIAMAYLGSLAYLGFYVSPTKYHFPLKEDWDHLEKVYFPLEGAVLYEKLISQNIEAIERCKEVLERKARAVHEGIWALMGVLVILSVARLCLATS